MLYSFMKSSPKSESNPLRGQFPCKTSNRAIIHLAQFLALAVIIRFSKASDSGSFSTLIPSAPSPGPKEKLKLMWSLSVRVVKE